MKDLQGYLVNRDDDKEVLSLKLGENYVARSKEELLKQAKLETEQFMAQFLAGNLEFEPPDSSKLPIKSEKPAIHKTSTKKSNIKSKDGTEQAASETKTEKVKRTRKVKTSEEVSNDLSISKNELAKQCAELGHTVQRADSKKTKSKSKKIKEEEDVEMPATPEETARQARLKEIELESQEKKELLVRKYQTVLAKSFIDTDFLFNRMPYFPIETKQRVTTDLNYYTPEEVSACQLSLFNHVENSSLLDYQLPTVFDVMEVATTMPKSLKHYILTTTVMEKQSLNMIDKQKSFKEYIFAKQNNLKVSSDNLMLEEPYKPFIEKVDKYLNTKVESVELINKEVVHSKLFYRAKLDGVWLFKKDQETSQPSLVYLKLSAKKKSDIRAWYNHPLRAVAAYGALKRDKELENHGLVSQLDSLTLVNFDEEASSDGPSEYVLNKQQIEMYWSRWLQALRIFWQRVYKYD